ncbi:MAG: M23 family metallopeptidase [Alphaproteobacteria bacterium]|nr:M23 family metallopeptidase [Alphaproteobacteria bacterium]
MAVSFSFNSLIIRCRKVLKNAGSRIRNILPTKTYFITKKGVMITRILPSWFRWTKTAILSCFFVVSVIAIDEYVYNNYIVDHSEDEVFILRQQQKDLFNFYEQYYDDFLTLQKKLIKIDSNIIKDIEQYVDIQKIENKKLSNNFLEEYTKNSLISINPYLKDRINIIAQLGFIYEAFDKEVNEIVPIEATSWEYHKSAQVSSLIKETATLEFENNRLNIKNEKLERAMATIKELQFVMLDKMHFINEEENKKLNIVFDKISADLNKIGIRNIETLSRRLEKNKIAGVGGPFIPVSVDDIVGDEGIIEESDYELYSYMLDQTQKTTLLKVLSTILPMGKPVDKRINSRYGIRISPFTKKKARHTGVDMATEIGTPIFITTQGTVSYASSMGSYGKTVVVKHGLGFSTMYAHLDEILVKKGDFVNSGDIIAETGNTGRSTGPHLHYEIRFNNQPFNPINFVRNIFTDLDK